MNNIEKTSFIAVVTAVLLAAALACGSTTPAASPAPPTANAAPAATQTTPETPAADASPEQTDSPSPVPSGAPADSSPLPPAIQILSPEYQEAYRLLPDGEWAQRFIADAYFGDFNYEEWSVMDETPPDILDTPRELDLGTEWNLTRILRDDEEQEWFVEEIRELDADAARSFEAAQAEEDRLQILRTLFEEGRKDQEILDIFAEWEMRKARMPAEEIARVREHRHNWLKRVDELFMLSPKESTVRMHELSVCELLVYFVIGGRQADAFTSGADCDIEAAASAAKQALESRGGQPIIDEDEFRELVEAGDVDPPEDPTPTIDI